MGRVLFVQAGTSPPLFSPHLFPSSFQFIHRVNLPSLLLWTLLIGMMLIVSWMELRVLPCWLVLTLPSCCRRVPPPPPPSYFHFFSGMLRWYEGVTRWYRFGRIIRLLVFPFHFSVPHQTCFPHLRFVRVWYYAAFEGAIEILWWEVSASALACKVVGSMYTAALYLNFASLMDSVGLDEMVPLTSLLYFDFLSSITSFTYRSGGQISSNVLLRIRICLITLSSHHSLTPNNEVPKAHLIIPSFRLIPQSHPRSTP